MAAAGPTVMRISPSGKVCTAISVNGNPSRPSQVSAP
jgi:hypothetical protein